eukprot:COSAG05_NODE_434_length_9856_cov_1158.820027_4_plen_99_part_00
MQAAEMHRARSEFALATNFLRRSIQLDPMDSSSWASLGFCSLMMGDADEAFISYQQALYLPGPADGACWYGLGLLYERNVCDDQAAVYLAQVPIPQPI